jgi:hypothetical protein
VFISGLISEDVEESEGVMYSEEAARRNVSRLLQEQVTLVMPEFGRVGFPFGVVVFGFAAVRSQCRFMKIGISEKARKRCVLIWALGIFVS